MCEHEIKDDGAHERGPNRRGEFQEIAAEPAKEGMILRQAVDRFAIGQNEMQPEIG